MKKKLIIFIVLIVILTLPLSACNNTNKGQSNEQLRDEHLTYFETEVFTEESFKEAIKKYGSSSLNSNGEKSYYLSYNQVKTIYKNSTVKPLLTSSFYDSCESDNIDVRELWNYLANDLFAKDIIFTVDGLVETIKEYCVWTSSSTSTHCIISACEDKIYNNPSVKEICENNGAELFNKLYTANYVLYEDDIIDLFKKTNTWETNCSIAYTDDIWEATFPLIFEDFYWYNDNGSNNGNGYEFENSDLYPRIVNCIKYRLKDPSSYRANGNIEFYSKVEPYIYDGLYDSLIFLSVPIRAKNGFGGYGNTTYWLTYNWKQNTVSWYGETMPSGVKYFKTKFVSIDLS